MNLIRDMEAITASIDEEAASFKPLPGKWSKKELLGHLIDSAINNIKRFTEIRFTEKPYVVQPYKQDALVEANAYRDKPFRDIFFYGKN